MKSIHPFFNDKKTTWGLCMNISLDTIKTNQNVDNGSTSYRTSEVHKSETNRGYAIDISGNVMDNKAYAGQGKTTEDVMSDASQADVTAQRNYMTVMSSTMSEEDFAKLAEDGFEPGSTDIKTTVTIVDKIKATLAASGTQIAGYTDDLSKEQLTAITGSVTMSNAISTSFQEQNVPPTKENIESAVQEITKASDLTELTDSVKKYMVGNQLEPTLENVYKAQYSAKSDNGKQTQGYFSDDLQGYYGKKAEAINFDALAGQMEKVITDAGLESSKETIAEAKWLVEKGVPLTPQNLFSLNQLDQISLPLTTEQTATKVAIAISEGKSAKEANLVADANCYERAALLQEQVSQITEASVEQLVSQNKSLNIRNLWRAQSEEVAKTDSTGQEKNIQTTVVLSEETKATVISAKRKLEEVRLKMTVEANVRLLKSGILIDTTELSKLVEQLKAAETVNNQALFPQDDAEIANEKAQLFEESVATVSGLKQVPVDVVGTLAFSHTSVNLVIAYREGSALKVNYESANKSYEALMTAPRSDLGDSIKKAFQNVDALLEEAQLEVTDENQRAVRILGYNEMEITKDTVEKVKTADSLLTDTVSKLTPAATLSMIREGVNPLEMDLSELNSYLTQKETEQTSPIEEFSKYLYSLEQNNEITQQEKEAYIGIYRLFRQVEKGDDAAVGSILNSDQALSVKNLLTAVRTRKTGYIDEKVDASTGMTTKQGGAVNSISEQINQFFDAARLQQMEETLADTEHNASLQKEQIEAFRKITKVSDEAIEHLLNHQQSVTPDSLLASDYLLNNRGATFKKLQQLANDTDQKKQSATGATKVSEQSLVSTLEDAVSTLQDAMTDKESMSTEYQKFMETAQSVLEDAGMNEQANYIDVKSMVACNKQLSLCANLAKEETYEVPVKIGEELTSVTVRMIHDSEHGGKVSASMETEKFGKVTAGFYAEETKISAYVASDRQSGLTSLKEIDTALTKALQESLQKEIEISYVHSKELKINQMEKQKNTASNVSNKELYDIAKAFIVSLSTQEKEGV